MVNIYSCPICKQHRGSKKHTQECSKKAKELGEVAREKTTPYNELPSPRPYRSSALNRFH